MKSAKQLILVSTIFTAVLYAGPVYAQEEMFILTGDVLIEYEDFFSSNSAVRALKTTGLRQFKELDAPNLFRCRLPADLSDDLDPKDVSAFLDELRSLAVVKYAEADYIVFSTEAAIPDETGVLVPPEDPDALARETLALLNHSGRREAMGRAARELAESRFGIKEHGRLIARVYQSVLGAPEPQPTDGASLSQVMAARIEGSDVR